MQDPLVLAGAGLLHFQVHVLHQRLDSSALLLVVLQYYILQIRLRLVYFKAPLGLKLVHVERIITTFSDGLVKLRLLDLLEGTNLVDFDVLCPWVLRPRARLLLLRAAGARLARKVRLGFFHDEALCGELIVVLIAHLAFRGSGCMVVSINVQQILLALLLGVEHARLQL